MSLRRWAGPAEFLGFQLVWFACVIGAARGTSIVGLVAALSFAALCVQRSPARARAWMGLAAVGALGWLVDSLLAALGWMDYACAPAGMPWAPAWIVALWIAFAATFRSSMSWLTRRTWVCAALCAVFAPFSYLGAERLGALSVLAHEIAPLVGIGAVWGLAVPIAVAVESRITRPTQAH